MTTPPIRYKLNSIKGSKKKVRNLLGIVEIADITTEEAEEWTAVTDVILPYARQLAKNGEDPFEPLKEAKKRCPVDISADIEKIIKIYVKNYQPTFSF